MNEALMVERAGLQTLVVDAGRFGYRHDGLAWCSPADTLAYDVANALVCNAVRAAVIEVLLGAAAFRFEQTRAFSLAGADCDATLDGERCAAWAKHVAREGSVLLLRTPKRGTYTYVSVGGGIDVPAVLGSRTTDRVAGIGGYDGRTLRAGDRLTLGGRAIAGPGFAISPPSSRDTVRVIPGGEIEQLDEASRAALWSQPWTVHHESNRMGYRLHGAQLRYEGEELPSHAVFPGVIQLPPSREPIVLLADAHTTGGYPKAGVVIDDDLRHVAQRRPGETLKFAVADAVEAAKSAQRRAHYLQTLRQRALERSGT